MPKIKKYLKSFVFPKYYWYLCTTTDKMTDNMKRDEEYDSLIDAADVICGICVCRSEKRCEKCPVRKTIDNYYKQTKQ